MKCLALVAVLIAVAVAHPTQKSRVRLMYGDEYKSYRFEEHDLSNGKHFVLVVKDKSGEEECHVVDIDSHFETLLNDTRFARKITKSIYQYIRWAHASELPLTDKEFFDQYQDKMAAKECKNHKIFYLPAYSPHHQLKDADEPIPDDNDGEIGPDDKWDYECDPDDAQKFKDFFDMLTKDKKQN